MFSKFPLISSFLFCTLTTSVSGQAVISLENPSFEDIPRKGVLGMPSIIGWHDCGLGKFPSESPPDIHPVVDKAWDVAKPPYDGESYLGMVTRANDSWESLSQALSSPIQAGICYSFSAFMVQSDQYKSATSRTQNLGLQELENFVRPSLLMIWGGNSFCDKAELLGESPAVSNSDWKMYKFVFQPQKNHKYITIEAFYKTPILEAYNGHILVDKLSDLVPVACPLIPTDIIAEVSDPPVKFEIAPTKSGHSNSPSPGKTKSGAAGTIDQGTIISNVKSFKPVILTELDPKKVFIGQKIRLTHLYFKPDSINLQPDSYKVLNELAEYLKAFPKTTIEIGGHSNTVPPEDYCYMISTARAKSVQQYLISQGIPEPRLKYKGYGKSDPLITYDKYNKEARLKNQRVEIKILTLS